MTAKEARADRRHRLGDSITTNPNPRVFVSAGEASGDHYGAELIAELLRRVPGATFFGLGGTEMERAGQRRVVRAEDVAVMGITEILRHVPRIYRSYRRLVGSIEKDRPDVAVLIDFPDVNFRLAKHCKRLGIPVVWFVSPQLWAWKRRRLRWVQERVSRMMVIFPFEAAFYKARGVVAEFVGHPLAALPLPSISREQYAAAAREMAQDQWLYSNNWLNPTDIPAWALGSEKGAIRYALDPAKPWIALLPGSRVSEIRSNLPAMIEAAIALGEGYEFIIPVAQTITETQLDAIRYDLGDLYLAGPGCPRVTLVRDARAAMFHARAAVVASGTATVQALTIGNPFIVVYRVSRITFALAKRMVRYPEEIPAPLDGDGNVPIGMVNLIAGKRIVPELINERFTGAAVASAIRSLVKDGPERARMIADLEEARGRLSGVGAGTPVERVAEAVVEVMGTSVMGRDA